MMNRLQFNNHDLIGGFVNAQLEPCKGLRERYHLLQRDTFERGNNANVQHISKQTVLLLVGVALVLIIDMAKACGDTCDFR